MATAERELVSAGKVPAGDIIFWDFTNGHITYGAQGPVIWPLGANQTMTVNGVAYSQSGYLTSAADAGQQNRTLIEVKTWADASHTGHSIDVHDYIFVTFGV